MESNNQSPTALYLEILAPEGEIYKAKINEITLPTAMGQITVLAGHAPLFSKITDGEIMIKADGDIIFVAIAGGFLEVNNNKVKILANYAIRSEEIEFKKAEEAKKRAESLLKQKKHRFEIAFAERELKRSILELKLAEKYQKRQKK